MRLRINWLFFGISTGVVVALLAALHFFHGWQVRQQTGAFIREADAAQVANDPAREIQYLRRYLIANSSDIERQDRLARLLAQTARGKQECLDAFLALENVLQRDPSRSTLRRVAFEFALTKIGKPTEAKTHLELLLRESPKDGELKERMAFLLVVERKYAAAADWYAKAYADKPDLIVAYNVRAVLLRDQLNKPDDADEVIQSKDKKSGLVPANATNYGAHLLKAQYGRQYGKPEWLVEGLAEARRLAPDEPEVILAVVQAAREAARTAKNQADADAKRAEAKAEIERALEKLPKSVPLLLARAEVAADVGGPSAAVTSLATAVDAVPDQPDLLLPLAAYQSNAGDPAAAAATLDRLTKLNVNTPRVDFQRARVLVGREEWTSAVKALLAVRRAAVGDSTLVREASVLLGRCYGELGEPDRQLDAFTQAVPDDVQDPQWGPAVAGQAAAYAALGRPEEALATYQKLANRGSTAAWAAVARLRMRQVLFRAPADRNWDEVERAVRQASDGRPAATDVRLLQADLLAAQGKPDEAKKIVDDLYAERPKEPVVLAAKAAVVARAGKAADAVDLLRKGREALGDPVDLRLEEARWTDPADPDAGKKLLALAGKADSYPATARRRLLRGLAEIAAAVGARAASGELWEAVVRDQPDDLSAHLAKFDVAMVAGDEDGMKRVEEQIRRIDGESGSSARMAKALRLLWRAQQKKEPSGAELVEAVALFDALERDRTRWRRVTLGKAVALDLQGKKDEALPLFQRAVSEGEKSPEVLRKLTTLLAAKGRYADANAVLKELPDDALTGTAVLRMAADVSLAAEESPKRALEMALRAVPADSSNADDLVWLGTLLWKAGDREKAEAAFRRAVFARPNAPAARLLVIDCRLAANQRGEAEAEFEAGRKAVANDERPLFVARGLAALGKTDEAGRAFVEAWKARPESLAEAVAAADFLTTTGQLKDARDAWERVLNLKVASADDKRFARVMIATCFAAEQDYTLAKRAVEVLGLDPNSGLVGGAQPATSGERRARAVALAARRDRSGVLAAVRLMEDADRLDSVDLFLLANLHRQVNADAGVEQAMNRLLRADDRNPYHLAWYARWLIDHDRAKEAEPLVAKLEKRLPDVFETGELRVRVSAALGDQARARAALKVLAARPAFPRLLVALVAEQAGLVAEAEEHYKTLVAAEKKEKPTAAYPLAAFFARRGRMAEAMLLLEEAWKVVPAKTAGQSSLEVLAAGGNPKAELDRVARWIADAFDAAAKAKSPDADPLAFELAYARSLQGDHDAALKLYEGLEKGGDAPVLNNLAYLRSAHQKRHVEALALLETAKGKPTGPLPELLDTQALVLLNRDKEGDAAEARKLLQDVAAFQPSGAVYFHLARAEEKLKKDNDLDFKAALAEAKRRKLNAADLHPLELDEFRRLVR